MNATQTINIFTDLLTTQPNLFAQALPELVELEPTVKALADNQEEEIAKAIRSFCKKQTAIRDVMVLRVGEQRGAGNTSYKLSPEQEKTLREQLLNAIRRNLPASSSPEAKPPKLNI